MTADSKNEAERASLNSLELLGVVSPRLAHRLSNHVSVIVGNLAIHDSPKSTVKEKAEAIAAIREVSNRAGELLGHFSDLARGACIDESHCALPDLVEKLREWTATRAGWELEVTWDVLQRGGLAMAGPWKWLAFSLDAIVGASSRGIVRINRAPPPARATTHLDVANQSFISLTVSLPGGSAIQWHDQRERLESWPLTATFELLQRLGAPPESRAIGPDAETRILIALHEINR